MLRIRNAARTTSALATVAALFLLGAWGGTAHAELVATYSYTYTPAATPPWSVPPATVNIPQYNPVSYGGQPLAWMDLELSATMTGSVTLQNVDANLTGIDVDWEISCPVNLESPLTSVITSVDPTAGSPLAGTHLDLGQTLVIPLNVTEASAYYAWGGDPLLSSFSGSGTAPVNLVSLAGSFFALSRDAKLDPVPTLSQLVSATVTVRYYVPEPGTLALAGLAAAAALLRRRSRA